MILEEEHLTQQYITVINFITTTGEAKELKRRHVLLSLEYT